MKNLPYVIIQLPSRNKLKKFTNFTQNFIDKNKMKLLLTLNISLENL